MYINRKEEENMENKEMNNENQNQSPLELEAVIAKDDILSQEEKDNILSRQDTKPAGEMEQVVEFAPADKLTHAAEQVQVVEPAKMAEPSQITCPTQETKKNKAKNGKYLLLVFLLSILGSCIGFGLGFSIRNFYPQEKTMQKLPLHLEMKAEQMEKSKEGKQEANKTENSEKLLNPRQISKLASPAVVAINSETELVNFFGQVSRREVSGSGVIISPEGYIATNNHVVEGAKNLSVHLSDGTRLPAKLIGTDKETDLAVIKVERKTPFPYLQMANSDLASVGDQVVAIGNPLGEFAGSLTVGYISALDRSLTVQDEKGRKTTLIGLIQTDAAINRGNSGGALINMKGELLGINTLKTAAVGVEGLGFAIPSNLAKPVIEDIINHGSVKQRPIIGIRGQAISREIEELYGLPVGILVREVIPNSPADKAGLKAQDIIISFNGKKVMTVNDMNAHKNVLKAGDEVELEIVRQGQKQKIKLVLELSKTDNEGETNKDE